MNEKRFSGKHGKDGSGSDHHQSTHLMELPPKLRERLKNHRREKVHGTYFADIERCFGAMNDHNFYLKRHPQSGNHNSVREKEVHNWLFGKIPVARVEKYESWNENDYLLLCEMWGLRFSEYFAKVKHEELILVLAEALKRFHSVTINPHFNESITHKILRARKNVALGYVRRDIYCGNNSKNPTADLYWVIHKKPAPSAEVLTHGDFNLRNLLFDETGVCAYLDLGEVGSCDPYQDFSTLWVSMEQYLGDTAAAADIMQEVLAEYGIENIDMEKIAYFRLLNELL